MNDLFFSCTSCRVFVDAGYRWAYWTLEETGVVRRGGPVNAEKVLVAEEYWHPEKDQTSEWLYEEVFPSVRRFFAEHADHAVVFGELDDFLGSDSTWFLEWIQEGFLAETLPRECLERLRLKSWPAVDRYVQGLRYKPGWWTDPDQRQQAERWYKSRLIQMSGRV